MLLNVQHRERIAGLWGDSSNRFDLRKDMSRKSAKVYEFLLASDASKGASFASIDAELVMGWPSVSPN